MVLLTTYTYISLVSYTFISSNIQMYTESVHYVIKKRRMLGVLAVMLAIVRWRRRRRHYSLRMCRRKYGPLVDRDLERQKKLNDLYNSTDKNCISQLRMRKDVFWKLSTHLRDAGLVCDSVHVSVEEKLAIFLHTVGHNLRNRVVGFFLKRSSYSVEFFSKLCYFL